MAKLWHDLGEGIVLNDDVCAVRQSDGDFGLFGTPWGGGSNSRTAQQERLRAVFFLGHGLTNRCMPMKPARALSLLVSQAFLPGWDAARTQRVLDTCTDLVQETPCFQLLFRPTPDVVSLIKSLVHTVP